jgi:dihydrodipicolinate synthase/N-acetylneuraminate lyase
MSETAFERLPDEQRRLTTEALHTLSGANLNFVLMVFGADGVGAVLSNIAPEHAVGMLEKALAAAEVILETLQ